MRNIFSEDILDLTFSGNIQIKFMLSSEENISVNQLFYLKFSNILNFELYNSIFKYNDAGIHLVIMVF